MDIEKRYILNPAYFLSNDVHRAIIGAYDSPGMKPEMYTDNWTTNIHPFFAQFLSFFNGDSDLNGTILDIAKYLKISGGRAEILVRHLINNDIVGLKHENTVSIFPKNTLIEKGQFSRRHVYEPEQFIIAKELDMTSNRLYKPVLVLLELTMQCYTDCVYCYADRAEQKRNNLSLEQIINIIREAKSLGVVEFELNGGEILLHPHYKEILEELTANGYYPFISTKIPLRRDVLDFLKNKGLTNVQISLDSLDDKTLSETLKVSGSYASQMYNTLQMLDEMEFDWSINTVLTKYNSSLEREIRPLISKLSPFQNLKSITIVPAVYSLYKTPCHYNQIKIPLTDLEAISRYVEELSSQSRIPITVAGYDVQSDFEAPNKSMDKFRERVLCAGDCENFIILPDGKVTICEELYWHPRFIIGDLTRQSMSEVWMSSRDNLIFNLTPDDIQDSSPCKKCGEFNSCRNAQRICWKNVLLAYGHQAWDFPDPQCPYSPSPVNTFCLE